MKSRAARASSIIEGDHQFDLRMTLIDRSDELAHNVLSLGVGYLMSAGIVHRSRVSRMFVDYISPRCSDISIRVDGANRGIANGQVGAYRLALTWPRDSIM